MTIAAGYESLALGVGVGGAKIAAGLVDSTGRIVVRSCRHTPSENPAATELVLADVFNQMPAQGGYPRHRDRGWSSGDR